MEPLAAVADGASSMRQPKSAVRLSEKMARRMCFMRPFLANDAPSGPSLVPNWQRAVRCTTSAA